MHFPIEIALQRAQCCVAPQVCVLPTRPTEGACFGNHGKGVGGQHCPHHVAAHGGHVHAAMAAGGVLWQPWWGRAVAAMVGPCMGGVLQ